MYNNIVPTLLFMVVFYRDFHRAKTYRKQKEKTNKQTNNLNNSSQLIFESKNFRELFGSLFNK